MSFAWLGTSRKYEARAATATTTTVLLLLLSSVAFFPRAREHHSHIPDRHERSETKREPYTNTYSLVADGRMNTHTLITLSRRCSFDYLAGSAASLANPVEPSPRTVIISIVTSRFFCSFGREKRGKFLEETSEDDRFSPGSLINRWKKN